MMKTSDFNFDLPQELIAQDPLEDRSSSRLMVLNKESGEITHRIFHDITEYLQPGDCLVINDTKVIPARLIGTKEDTGAHIEILLLKRKENEKNKNSYKIPCVRPYEGIQLRQSSSTQNVYGNVCLIWHSNACCSFARLFFLESYRCCHLACFNGYHWQY